MKRKKLRDTTIVVHVHKELKDTIEQALTFTDNVIIYDDCSQLDLSKYNNLRIIRADEFSGFYEVSLRACLPFIGTKYIVRVNAGDEILHLEEPKTADIFLANYNGSSPDHHLDKDFYKSKGASIISGSVIPMKIYKEILASFTPKMKAQWKRFGKYCGDKILNNYTYRQSDIPSYTFTFNMWGGRKEAHSL